ncbi:hypothetical protein D3C81_186740 [compost metagenome]
MPIKTSLGASSMPSHSSSRGTQASEGIARRAWNVGASSASALLFKPTAAPSTTASRAPPVKPMATRTVLASTWPARPWCASAAMVAAMSLGAGSRLAGMAPVRTPSSAAIKTSAGSSSPHAARGRRGKCGLRCTPAWLDCVGAVSVSLAMVAYALAM